MVTVELILVVEFVVFVVVLVVFGNIFVVVGAFVKRNGNKGDMSVVFSGKVNFMGRFVVVVDNGRDGLFVGCVVYFKGRDVLGVNMKILF